MAGRNRNGAVMHYCEYCKREDDDPQWYYDRPSRERYLISSCCGEPVVHSMTEMCNCIYEPPDEY